MDDRTMKFCPYCGRPATTVEFEGHNSWTRLGKFRVECNEGHISDVYWPDEDHDEDCECEMHLCENCQDAKATTKAKDGTQLCSECAKESEQLTEGG